MELNDGTNNVYKLNGGLESLQHLTNSYKPYLYENEVLKQNIKKFLPDLHKKLLLTRHYHEAVVNVMIDLMQLPTMPTRENIYYKLGLNPKKDYTYDERNQAIFRYLMEKLKKEIK